MNKPSREYTVELYRFIFCIAVLGFHFFSKIESPIMRAGYLGVEFFFLLSGYGVFCFYKKNISQSSFADGLTQIGYYIGNRIIRLYPLYLLSVIFMFFIKWKETSWTISQAIDYLKLEWAELLWLQCGPLGNEVLISANWYIPALFWGSLILLVLLLITRKIGGLLLCPCISIGIYGYYLHLIHKIDVIFSYHAILRGIAGLALGIAIGFWIDFIKMQLWKKEIDTNTRIGYVANTLYYVANLVLVAIFIYMNFGRRSNLDFVVIGLYCVALFILLYRNKEHSKLFITWAKKLSSVTYPVYIFQMPCIEIVLHFIGKI